MKIKTTFVSHATVILWLFIAATTGHAQSINGRIVGAVTDPNGAVIPKASVIVTNEGTGAERRLDTDESGTYVAAELPVGLYTVRTEAADFAPSINHKIKVDVGAETRVNIVMSVQGVQQSVTVEDVVPVLQLDSSALAEVINNRQVESLPINGRDFRRLTTLVPGAAPRSQRGSLGSFTVNGQREKANIFLIDGVDNNDSFRNQPSFNQGGVTGAPATLFPVDALGEFNIQTQGAAEYGRNSGAVLNIVVKSGTNDFHGSLYEFNRVSALAARRTDLLIKPPITYNYFGGTFGGAIVKNKTFFFGDYLGVLDRLGKGNRFTIPTADFRAGNLSQSPTIIYDPRSGNPDGTGRTPFTGNIIPADRISPIAAKLNSLLPAPTSSNATGVNFEGGTVRAKILTASMPKLTTT